MPHIEFASLGVIFKPAARLKSFDCAKQRGQFVCLQKFILRGGAGRLAPRPVLRLTERSSSHSWECLHGACAEAFRG